MPARPARPGRKAATLAALGLAPLALTALAAAPASAHGTMGGPVSRVFQCYAEGPESPRSAACKAAVAAGGTQALYDWNGVRIGDVNGRHQARIPDGKLCSANDPEFKGLDLPRADWPATAVRGGAHTFEYRVTAQHRGTFTVYITKPGYDPAKPPAWADLDLAHPVATVTDPVASGGFYTFSGTLPQRTGKQLLYTVWQRSDSPEAFYSCSDVTFPGGGSGAAAPGASAPAPPASAPTERQIEGGAGRSTVRHDDHHDRETTGTRTGAGAATGPAPATGSTVQGTPGSTPPSGTAAGTDAGPRSQAAVGGGGGGLAETGGGSTTAYAVVGGAAALAVGSAALLLSVRRRAAARHGR
ncbi:lytic polysaccharide monooxygenase auxiliary activity family 9 protein [Streptomyces sp. NRRL S-340]|uniref:lytic polysaccharide monooxygenase auxiliary activity family 9 protein n=1 Tax=Streptomyces sp. NRRL S-340 TaxID=1463901 RepID=UPI00056BC1BD|nr:lytic polysaccharide monooxygenase [Streptomyces sp. NRRL S-340]